MSTSSSISAALPVLRAAMSRLRVPSTRDKVYKDECVYSFDSPFSDDGLYVNIQTFHGVGKRFLRQDATKTGCKAYLHERWLQLPKAKAEVVPFDDKPPENTEAPSKLAIGIDGGFLTESQYDLVKEHDLVIVEDGEVVQRIPLPCAELPEFVSNVLQGIIDHDGMRSQLQVNTWEADNTKIVSKYAEGLPQVNPQGIKIPQDPKLWKDAASDATDNLWLNLSTGYIGGGRLNWDGTGGSGSALQHYLDTGKLYPLVVKLGTITPHGADVWSYSAEEDCLVIDPHLAEHLSFWGIDSMKLEKTEKSVSEMEVAINMSYDWSKLMEGQEKLEALNGPGFVGLRNIGSSCYMNSVMQCILAIPEVQERYLQHQEHIIATAPSDPSEDIATQLSKVAHAVLTDTYVAPMTETVQEAVSNSLEEMVGDASVLEKYVVAPRMFKHAVAKGNSDFSSGHQQDVADYFRFFLEQLARSERTSLSRIYSHGAAAMKPTPSIFEYHSELKWKVVGSNEVKITKFGQGTLCNMLELNIPLDKGEKVLPASSTTDESNQEVKRARVDEEPEVSVPFSACLDTWVQPDLVTVTHPQTNKAVECVKTTRFASFPRYLVIKLNRYYLTENWTSKKITAEVPMPEELDLSHLRGTGVGPDEVEMAEAAVASTATTSAAEEVFTVDEELVAGLISMGFSENGSRRAAIATKNADLEVAMNWVLEHMEDPDFNEPPAVPSSVAAAPAASSGFQANEEAVAMLSSMGYTTEQVTAALKATNNDIERAADWLFSRDNLDEAVAEVLATNTGNTASAGSSTADATLEAGEGKYRLMSIISHIGKDTGHGHYICHIKKNGVWALFNDEKVGKSEKPPLQHGFMYVYRRVDGPGSFY